MADDVTLSRSIVQIFVVTNRIQLVFMYNDRYTHSCFSAIQLTTSSSLSQNLGRLNLFTTRVTNNRYSTIPTLYIYSRPTLAYLSPRLFVRIPIYRNAYELCTVHRNVIFTTDPSIMDPKLWSCSRKPFIVVCIVLISTSTTLLELEIVEFVLEPTHTALRCIWCICQLWQARGLLPNSPLFHAALLDQSSHESLGA